ncbi:hypothetical protein B296_00055727 [Ensete ventricosum]|uniref:Uncharacterized protein n=1 Tax=Ensete ventricosum TaxID=4639 RepID=A0A426XN48_ENSVE|nr:hypothetical protein B296_00055727 [Ensete ventricosum]
MSGAGFDAGEGNPGSVIILQKRLGVGTAAATSSVGRGWSGSTWRSVPESMNGHSGDMDPPSSAKNDRGESGACLVDEFRLRVLVDYTSTGTPPYFRPASCLRRVDHVGGPAIREYDDVAGQLSEDFNKIGNAVYVSHRLTIAILPVSVIRVTYQHCASDAVGPPLIDRQARTQRRAAEQSEQR